MIMTLPRIGSPSGVKPSYTKQSLTYIHPKALLLRGYRPVVQAGITERAVKTLPWIGSAVGAVFGLAGGVFTLGLFPLITGASYLITQPLKPFARMVDRFAGKALEGFQARHYVRSGQVLPGYRPTTGMIGYRLFQAHVPHLTALGAGKYGAELGYELASQTGASREMERLLVGATTGGLSGWGGWHVGKYLQKHLKEVMRHVLR
ncbi:MAG: hypothetical protein ACKO37_05565 [Vampirovibrionales bacterium]